MPLPLAPWPAPGAAGSRTLNDAVIAAGEAARTLTRTRINQQRSRAPWPSGPPEPTSS